MRFAAVTAAAFVAVDPWGWDRFGPLRWALVSTLAFAAVAASLGEASFRERPLPRWLVLGWTLLLVGVGVSTALSADRLHSVIGTPDRHFGLLTWCLCVGLFTTSSLHASSATRAVLRALTLGAIVGGAYAIFELYEIDWFDQNFADDRAGGPFGQPAFLGAAMVLAVPASVSRIVDHAESFRWRISGVLGVGLGLIALLASQSRAAWVGFALTSVLVAISQRRRIRMRFGKIGIALLVVTLCLAVVAIAAITPVGDRALTLTEADGGVVAGRIDEWQVGGRALIGAPAGGLIGYGPEAYRTVFGEYVDEQYVIDHGREAITDRAHNGLLDTALSGGFPAGLGLLLLQVGLCVESLRRLGRGPIDVAIASAVLAYTIQQFFLFPLAELDPVMWILAGLLIGRIAAERSRSPRPILVSVPRSRQLVMLGAGFLAALSAIAGLTDVVADHRIDAAVSTPDGAEALDAADSARNLRPDSIRYDFIAARVARVPGDADSLAAAIERIEAGIDTSRDDPALNVERAGLLLDLARLTDDPDDLLAALQVLEARDRVDPNHPLTQQWYGIALALSDRVDEAIVHLRHAASLAPDAPEPLINLAVVQFEAGDLIAGEATLERARLLAPMNTTIQELGREFLSR